MGFLDVSVVNATTVNKGTTAVATAQQSVGTTLSTPSAAVATSLTASLKGASTSTSTISSLTTGTTTAAQNLENAAIKTAVAVGSSYLQTALKSVSSTFGGSSTSLASGISQAFTSLFTNTNVNTASQSTRAISDPVLTNLLGAKTPASTSFKVDSLVSGSQSLTMSGTSSVFGSGAAGMAGTILSSVLGRFNLDSTANLGSQLTSAQASASINALFSPLIKDTSSLVSSAVGGGQLGATLGKLTSVTLASSLGVTKTSTLSTSTTNDLQLFQSKTSDLSTALGGVDLSSYYQTNPTTSLVNQDGVAVSTNQSGVDSTTANAILSLIKLAGCAVTTTDYYSASNQSSLYNLALKYASINGMSTEVSNLLGCSHSSTTLGQQSLVGAFVASSNSQLGISSTILGQIDAPLSLNTSYVAGSVLTNPNLTASSVTQVDSLFNTIGTSTANAFSIGNTGVSTYPVFNSTLLYTAQPSFVNGVMGDTTMTDFFNGAEMGTSSDGTFGFIGI